VYEIKVMTNAFSSIEKYKTSQPEFHCCLPQTQSFEYLYQFMSEERASLI
jgi:hypothetical protein